MKVAIRVDSAVMLGSGHVMRCLTLAERLRKSGADVVFICRDYPGHMMQLIKDKGFMIHVLPMNYYSMPDSVEDFIVNLKNNWNEDLASTQEILRQYGRLDWVVVDHYALDEKWEKGIRENAKKICVIDDLANRRHDCDILLDQNFHTDMGQRYNGLLPAHCKELLGPKYLLLREEFFEAQFQRPSRDGYVQNVLVFFGGSDPTNETQKTVCAIKQLDRPDIHFDVVVGNGYLYKKETQELCETLSNVEFYCQVNYMAKLMLKSDLAIGAGGSATWERCFLGLPALIIVLADNQRQGIEELSPYGAFINLGWHDDIDSQKLCEHLKSAISRPDLLKEMSLKAKKLVGIADAEYKDGIIVEFWRK